MNPPGIRLILCWLMLTMALLCGVHIVRADQADDAIALLTKGTWSLNSTARHFLETGKMTAKDKVHGGAWRITGNDLDIFVNNGNEFKFPLPIDPKGNEGREVRKGGKATLLRTEEAPSKDTDAQAEAAPTPPISATVQAEASTVIQSHHDSLVFVTGNEGAGSGFIVKMGTGGSFLITNVHVAAGIRDAAFKTLAGQAVQTGVPSMAVGEDIFCMAMPAGGGTPFELMQDVDANAAVGDDVVVLGNAEGGGVINTIIGKIVGIGPDLVEVDAPFVPGNSGSPIIHLKTGKVIGVATYTVTNQYDLTTNKKLSKPIIRRFGYRVDSVKGWQAINWQAFYAQAAETDQVDGLTKDLYDFVEDLADNNGKLTPGRHTNPIIKNQIDAWMDEKGSHPSAEDAAAADTRFIAKLKQACQAGIPQAQQQITYDYFRRDLKDQIQGRNQLANDFQDIIRAIGQ